MASPTSSSGTRVVVPQSSQKTGTNGCSSDILTTIGPACGITGSVQACSASPWWTITRHPSLKRAIRARRATRSPCSGEQRTRPSSAGPRRLSGAPRLSSGRLPRPYNSPATTDPHLAGVVTESCRVDAVDELDLRIEDESDLLSRIAKEPDCRVEYEGLATISGDDGRVFLSRETPTPRLSVTGTRLVSDVDGYLFEVTTAAPLVAAKLVTTPFDALTGRQREVLEAAYLAGFLGQPRETTGEELDAVLGVSQPTVNRHLRLAQQQLVGQLFTTGEERAA
ncbi:helix-turn-helix domain-containing protein [Halorientalis sp.]|uniref:helix-turn-helix domain-containing protein n=1 Tax=Halorientalis sp. TaxID=1931229 RepID=UPI0026141F16|nr:helix-turn-helix domain-containing protein [Halorientalis sp.]